MQFLNTLMLSIIFGLVYWLIPGIVGGAITALVIKWTDLQFDLKRAAAMHLIGSKEW